MTGMLELETFANSVYFAVLAYFGVSLTIIVVWFALEKFKESRKKK